MTKTKFFIFMMLSLMGGLVLSAPSDALAADTADTPKFQLAQPSDKKCPEGQYLLVCTSSRKDMNENVSSWTICSDKIAEQIGDAACKNTFLPVVNKDGQLTVDTTSKEAVIATAKNNASQFGADSTTVGTENYDLLARTAEPEIKGKSDIANFVNQGLKEGKITYRETGITGRAKQLIQAAEDAKVAFNNALDAATANHNCDTKTIYTSTAYTLLGKKYSWVSHVNEILATCEIPVDEKAKETVMQKAQALENAIQAYKHMEEMAGSRDIVYQYCLKRDPKDNKCISFIEFVVSSDSQTITSVAEAVTMGCEPLPFKLHVARACLFCPLFEIIFNVIQKVSTEAFNMFGKDLAKLLLIGLALWIAYMVLQNVSSMTKQDAPKFLNDLFKASFKIVIVFILLSHANIIYNIILGPLLKAGFEFGVSFLSYSDSSELSKCQSLAKFRSPALGVLPNYVYQNLLCFIEAVQYELATTQAIGSSLMCVSTHKALSDFGPLRDALPDFSMLFQGVLIFIISLILSLAFGFYLIDATIQLGIFGMLLPFLLLCWPFKITNSYAKKGIEVFMNSWFVYVFMGIVVNISLQLIGKGLTGGKGGFDDIMAAINGNEVKKLQELLGIGFSGFVVLISCCIFGIKLMQKVEELAGKFSGGLNLGIGGNIGGLIAQSGTNLAKFGVQKAGGMAVGAGKKVLNARIFGKDGAEWSIGDKFRGAGNAMARGVGRGLTATGRGVGKVASLPFTAVGAAFRGLRGRRNPSA